MEFEPHKLQGGKKLIGFAAGKAEENEVAYVASILPVIAGKRRDLWRRDMRVPGHNGSMDREKSV